jgi:hypothetical protein
VTPRVAADILSRRSGWVHVTPACAILGSPYRAGRGGAVALQLAVQAPELVHTLVLQEPALVAVPSGEAFFGEMAPIVEM